MDFEALKDMIQVITRNKTKQIEVIGNSYDSEGEGSRVEELYNLIRKGKVQSDAEAAMHFFDKPETRDSNFRKLKNKLTRKLINTSFFMDAQKNLFNDRNSALINCYRDYVAAQILFWYNAHKAAAFIFLQVLEQAIKFEFTELVTEITNHLRNLYRQSDPASHERYSSLYKSYEEKHRWELKSTDYIEDLVDYYMKSRSPNIEIHKLASQYFDELYPQCANVNTFRFFLNTYNIGTIKYMAINDWSSAMTLSKEGFDLMVQKKSATRGGLISVALQQVSCATKLRMFEEGEKIANYCLEVLSDEDSSIWFKILDTKIYLSIYTKKYDTALDTYKAAVANPKFKALEGAYLDNWNLFGGYLHLLALLGKLPQEEVTKVVGPFRYSKFINDFEVADKDKEAMNIPLVFLPILISVVKDEYMEYGRSVDALEKYRQRYLNNDLNRRSECFLKMMMAYSKRAYEPEQSAKKVAKELERLRNEPITIARQSYEVEIIPYEDLWDMILEHHETKK